MQTLYFAYAVYGFTFAFISLSIQFELVNTYEYDASSLAFAWSSISLPWAFKPIYGYISDKAGRRICISVGSFVAAVLLNALASMHGDPVFLMTLVSLFICFSDVASDSIVVTNTRNSRQGLQSTCWTARSFGSMIGTGLSGMAYKYMGAKSVLRLSSAGPFILCIMIWEVQEPTISKSSVTLALKSVYKMRHLLLVAVFFGLTPEIGNALFPTIKDKLEPVEISLISVAGSFTACIVSFFYQYTNCSRTAMQTAVILSMICGILAFCTYVGVLHFKQK